MHLEVAEWAVNTGIQAREKWATWGAEHSVVEEVGRARAASGRMGREHSRHFLPGGRRCLSTTRLHTPWESALPLAPSTELRRR